MSTARDIATGAPDAATLRTPSDGNVTLGDKTARPLRVYLAASTAELRRARSAVEALAAAGFDVVSTWLDIVEQVGVANPADASREQRRAWTLADLAEVASADLLWFLVPPSFAPTRGAWVELGVAHTLNKLIVSSGTTKQSIFCALTEEFPTDDLALEAIRMIAKELAA